MTNDALLVAADLLEAQLDAENTQRQEEAEELAGSLPDFIKGAWHVLEPQNPYLHNWHIDAISDYLTAVSRGEVTRLIINIPPRYMKSISVSIMWPAWDWVARPHRRYLAASYSQNLATKHSVDRRTVIQSAWYQARWGDRFRLSGDQNVKTEFTNNKRGHMIATSFGGTGTGKGGDVVIIDDPMNPKSAASDHQRNRTNELFDQTFTTRLDNKKSGAIVVVMQRLHENDLTGHLLAQGGWEQLKLPAVAKERTIITTPAKTRYLREPGDILWPEREGPEEIAMAKTQLGTYGYSGQYDQDPSPVEGGMLKRRWWGFWIPEGMLSPAPPVEVRIEDGTFHTCPLITLPTNLETYLQSWDMAFKDMKTSDFVVGQVWASHGANKFLLDQVHDKLDFPSTLDRFRAMTRKWPQTQAKLVEDKANGPAVISTLKGEIAGIVAVEPQGGKEARVAAVSPQVEAGNVYLPHPLIAPWVNGFIEEAAAFPNGAYDDQVDAFSQAILRLTHHGGPASVWSPADLKI